MEAQTEDERKAKIEAYARALDFFIKQPNATNDPALIAYVNFFKERISQACERPVVGSGVQKQLVVRT